MFLEDLQCLTWKNLGEVLKYSIAESGEAEGSTIHRFFNNPIKH